MNGWQAIALILCCSGCLRQAAGQVQTSPTRDELSTWTRWSGLGAGGRLAVPGEAVFAYPDGPKGWHNRGLRHEHDGTNDWRELYGLRIDLELADDQPVELTATIRIPKQEARVDYLPQTKATVVLRGNGPHRVMLPWRVFDFESARPAFLKFVKELRLTARPTSEIPTAPVVLRAVRVVRGEALSIDAPVRGKSAPAGGMVEYTVQVGNCTDQPQAVSLAFEKHGWEAMDATVEPQAIELQPDQVANVTLRVKVPQHVPPGGHEKQVLVAVPNGDGSRAAKIRLITASSLPHPYVLHTPQRWQEVRDKVAKYEWARSAQQRYIERADRWNVPQVARPPDNLTGVDNMGPFLFRTSEEHELMAAGISYQSTGDKKYAQKVRTFLLRLSDSNDGYPATFRGCNQSLVQEGHFFQHIGMAYDMALPSGLFTEADRAQIEHTFRLYIETIEFASEMGSINNWNLSEICGALYCALVMQDLAAAERFFSGPGGVVDQLGKGTLDDGWWYECSISYNVWCASEFTQVALAIQPWGVNFRDMQVPVNFSKNYGLRPWEMTDGLYGMSFQKWGPITRSTVNIKHLWDALPRFTDWRGVMFAVNDATEARLGGHRREVGAQPFELAYYVYRDPVFAGLIKQGDGSRDLLYGVPELPEDIPEQFRSSAYADNVGVVMLRSQTADRPIRDQIQAVLHYGTHGGFHGHFDRTNLLSLMRYGRSFYNPEMIWYSYAPYMYKFYVQTSVSKNMVVVDQKMQEPVESQRLLFHSGKMMQATAVQTNARWSNPPYGGMVYPEQGYATLAEKAFAEGRHLTIPQTAPEYGAVTGFTEPVLQRRVMVVTDDYVLLADYLKGDKPHTFESLFQMKGFMGLDAPQKKLVRHGAQWNPDPIGSAQFVTDCDWYDVTSPAMSRFEMRWGLGADNEGTRAPESETGVLKLNVHTLWPPRQEIMVATAPEDHAVQKRLFYAVRGDGKTLAEGKFGAWILGQDQIDIPLAGVSQLELETKVEMSQKPTVFWGGARIVKSDGTEVPLHALPMKLDNVLEPKKLGEDHFGGPIKIVGAPFDYATPGQPKDDKRAAVVQIDLAGLNAARFKAVIGGDYPLGDESQRRKTYAVRSQGTEARFLTVIEPHEQRSVVKRAEAVSADELRVELADGRVQTIQIRNIEGDGKDIVVNISESRDGRPLRSETSGER